MHADEQDEAGESGQHIGHDDTGCVRITVDPDHRYTDVSISTTWRNHVGIDGLEAALTNAAGRARELAATREREAAAESSETPGRPAGPAHRSWDDTRSDNSPASFQNLDPLEQNEALFRLANQLSSATRQLARTRQHIRELLDTSFTGSDDRRRITVTLSATADITSVEADTKWLHSTPIDSLTTALRTALLNAQDSLDEAINPATPQTTPATTG